MKNIKCGGCGAWCQDTEISVKDEIILDVVDGKLEVLVIPVELCPFCVLDPDEPIPYSLTLFGIACLSNTTNLSKTDTNDTL